MKVAIPENHNDVVHSHPGTCCIIVMQTRYNATNIWYNSNSLILLFNIIWHPSSTNVTRNIRRQRTPLEISIVDERNSKHPSLTNVTRNFRLQQTSLETSVDKHISRRSFVSCPVSSASSILYYVETYPISKYYYWNVTLTLRLGNATRNFNWQRTFHETSIVNERHSKHPSSTNVTPNIRHQRTPLETPVVNERH